MSTNWDNIKSWPSRRLRNSNKLPEERNRENQHQDPTPSSRPAFSSSVPPLFRTRLLELGPAPCAQPSHFDPPPLRIPRRPASTSHRSRPDPAATDTPIQPTTRFFSASVTPRRHVPLRLRPRPFPIRSCFHKPHPQTNYPNARGLAGSNLAPPLLPALT